MSKTETPSSGKMGGPTPSSGKQGTVDGGLPKGIEK